MRFIDDGWRTGAENMARDEALAIAAGEHPSEPTLRLYRFRPACVTIGRFQDYPAGLEVAACGELGIDVVRRPTGGLAILHLDDFTYSATFSGEFHSGLTKDRVFSAVGEGILASLRILGVQVALAAHHGGTARSSPWCFESAFGVDLEWLGRKICGSAQKQSSRCILQHGSIFLESTEGVLRTITGSPAAGPPGGVRAGRLVCMSEAAGRTVCWEELREAFVEGFEITLGEKLDNGDLTPLEEGIAGGLLDEKYGTRRWLERPAGG